MASLEKIVLLLGSDQPFEALAARDALIKYLARKGLDLYWFAQQADRCITSLHGSHEGTAYNVEAEEIDHQAAAHWLLDNFISLLSTRERGFLENMTTWVGEPTEPQANWLEALVRRHGYRP
ncbi:hypothetical protein SAMN04515648_2896 [Phyllobacterium sp. CL33Tsu]|uniref:hypothetical protein n=1 Tax=Phyllobacterium sp. CL33Tsu TaxID=1798191 RepID=UPI0008ED8292|nr:hypothetical protein [Phyllobacterium sp. CL33Tsu]SFJ15173.1 hypothetical protein SAMN04515648_2896 [Phyllobacterium sp. CL33Tsu]